MDVIKVDRGDGDYFYAVQFEHGNAYYYVNGNFELEEFEQIINGMLFKNV